jgi:23S rRNA pseudouridine955/2504/2580 synthase/23S rRNA pseudouridine1911/1915/1917 synthase
MKRIARTVVPAQAAGLHLLDYLVSRFTYHSLADWCRIFSEGRVLLNGTIAAGETVLKRGDQIEYLFPDLPEPPVDDRFAILFQDEFLLAVDKSGNLPCHPAGKYFHHTLWALLKEQYPEDAFEFVNRLDRETSGIVLLARQAKAALACRRLFASQRVHKRYVVLVEGAFPEQFRCDGYLESDPGSEVRKKRRFVADENPDAPIRDRAQTAFRLLRSLDSLSLVEALPETGRLHQIRASLCSSGYPVVGDKLYGVDDRLFLQFIEDGLRPEDLRRLRLDRQALHAAELRFPHPVTGEQLRLSAPLPADMQALVTPGACASS